MRRVTQLVQQPLRVLELRRVLHPQLGQGLVGRHFAGDAARILALHRGRHAGVAEQVSPQGRQREVRSRGEAFHGGALRGGGIDGTIAQNPTARSRP